MSCPWCGSEGTPLRTADHLDEAEFQFGSPTPAHIELNPLMCPDCHGVGGAVDFGVDQ